jgi:hypothetical protein
MKNWAERKFFRIFEKIIFEFLHKGLANIYKNIKKYSQKHASFCKNVPFFTFPEGCYIKRRISKQPGFFVQEFAGHEMSDFFITYTCAKLFVKTPIFSKIFTETTFFYENRLFSRETEMFR